MKWLIDTNVLLRSSEPTHPLYPEALQATNNLFRRGEDPWITPQCLIEFWSMATRPIENNGLGLTTKDAEQETRNLESQFFLLQETPEIFQAWRRLVSGYKISGVKVYDARLVAVMIVNQISHLLTFDLDDFRKYSEIVPVHPRDIKYSAESSALY